MGTKNLEHLFGNSDIHVFAASVQIHVGETTWYRTNKEGDLIVSCVMHTHGTPVDVNMSGGCGLGNGVFQIPNVGTEVIIASDNGEFEGELYLVAMFTSGKVPAGLAPNMVFVLGSSTTIGALGGARFETDASGVRAIGPAAARIEIDGSSVRVGGSAAQFHTYMAEPYAIAIGNLFIAISTFLAGVITYASAAGTVLPVLAPAGAALATAVGVYGAAMAPFIAAAQAAQTTVTKVI